MVDHELYRRMLQGKGVYSIDYIGRESGEDQRIEFHITGGVLTITDPEDIRYITRLRHEALRLCARESEFRGSDIIKYIVFHLKYGDGSDEQ